MFDDICHALRRLAKRPGFVLAAVVTLTLGIGFNAVVFSVLNLLLLKPLPVREAERLVTLEGRSAPIWSFPNYLDVRDRNRVFENVAAMRIAPMHASRGVEKMRLWGYLVTGNYFEMLGVAPGRGRLLSPEDDGSAAAHPVAVLSYASWQSRFGGAPGIVGSLIHLNEHPFTIVGIAPPDFLGTERLLAADVWVPFSMLQEIEGRDWRESRRTNNAWTIARLKPGITEREAEASLAIVAQELAREHPDANEGMEIRLAPMGLLGGVFRGPAIGFGAALFLVSGLTLLVACANLSSLVLAQASDRRREFALRRSLGASRWALCRMVLAETLLLALGGCLGGILAAVWLGRLLAASLPTVGVPVTSELPVDSRVLAFAALAALASAGAVALLPALRSSAVAPSVAFRSGAPLHRLRRLDLRDLSVALQVALSVVLVAGALMTVQSLKNALQRHYGFTPESAVAVRFDLSMHGYDEERGRALQQEVLRTANALPGIEACGLANSIPFSIDQSFSSVYVEGRPVPPVSQAPSTVLYQATEGFFRALGTRLVAGREFDGRDDRESPRTAIVNETFVRRLLLPDEDPVGKRFRFHPEGELIEIVGVVEAGRYQTVTEEQQLAVWIPLAQSYNSTTTVVARTRFPAGEALSMIERAVERVAPDLLVFDAMSLQSYLDLPTTPLRIATASLSAMGALAAILSAVGLNALVAYAVSRRSREIGIRMALGADARRVLRVLLERTLLLVTASAVVGLALSSVVSPLLARLTFAESSFSEPAAAVALSVTAAMAATWLPARRALRIQPFEVLRQD